MKVTVFLIGLLLFKLIISMTTYTRSDFFLMNEFKVADNTFDKIIKAIEEKEPDDIKKLFSTNIIEENDCLEQDIINWIEYIQGDIVSYSSTDDTPPSSSYSQDRQGRDVVMIESVFDIYTTDKTYYVAIREIVKDDFDRDNEGIIYIYIIDSQKWWSYGVYRSDGKWTEGIHIDRE